ncbi:MAG TPA: ABC transporter permease subunit [Chloroflexia bacterium]|jgi:ABC-type transport system involved in multi-copper enzyme maturation permease subunit
MATHTDAIQERRLAQIGRPNPLRTVAAWELRRMAASRATWVGVALITGFFLFVAWLLRSIALVNYFYLEEPFTLSVTGSSAWGLVRVLPRTMLLILGVILPFLAAELVSRDLRRRTHEIIMSTPIPTWAYVWGRFLAGLVATTLLSLLPILAVALVGYAASLLAAYSLPNLGTAVSMWAVLILPAVLLLSGLSFAIGTLLPRFANLAKVLVVAAWFFGAYFSIFSLHDAAWMEALDPTSRGLSYTLELQYQQQMGAGASAGQREGLPNGYYSPKDLADARALQEKVRQVEQRPTDLWPWVSPHALIAALGPACVALAAAKFNRFSSLQ